MYGSIHSERAQVWCDVGVMPWREGWSNVGVESWRGAVI